MAKNKISEYSATAASNTDVANINIAEGCSPSNINNAIRAVMGHLKDFQDGSINATALAECLANATFSGDAIINSNGTITAIGYVLGEEWSDSAVGSETWSTVSFGNEIWVEDTPESNTWLRQG